MRYIIIREVSPLMQAQVLKGSHRVGRIDHNKVGGQMGADMERVEHLMKVSCQHMYTLRK